MKLCSPGSERVLARSGWAGEKDPRMSEHPTCLYLLMGV